MEPAGANAIGAQGGGAPPVFNGGPPLGPPPTLDPTLDPAAGLGKLLTAAKTETSGRPQRKGRGTRKSGNAAKPAINTAPRSPGSSRRPASLSSPTRKPARAKPVGGKRRSAKPILSNTLRGEAKAPTDPALVQEVRAYMKANRVSQVVAGQEARVSQAVISQWLSMKYHGHNDKVRIRLFCVSQPRGWTNSLLTMRRLARVRVGGRCDAELAAKAPQRPGDPARSRRQDVVLAAGSLEHPAREARERNAPRGQPAVELLR